MTVVGHKLGRRAWAAFIGSTGAVLFTVGLVASTVAGAAEAAVGLGTADSFAVLAGAGVTNTGSSVINGDLGTCPTLAVTGFPPGTVNGGSIHSGDPTACGAQSDLTIAYNDAAGRAPTTTYTAPTDLDGLTLTSGVYKSPSEFSNSGTLTLDGQGDPNAVFIFQAGSTLITAPNSHVMLINSAQACNVFWQVGSSATLGVGSTFVGTILALTSITANTNADIQGRLLARNGATTLDTNTVSAAPCAVVGTTTTTTAVGATTTTTTATPGATTTTAAPVAATTTTAPVGAVTATTAPAVTATTAAAPPLVTDTSTTTATAPGPGPSTETASATPSTVTPGGSTSVTGGGSAAGAPPGLTSITTNEETARGPFPATGGPLSSLALLGLAMLAAGCVLAITERVR